MRSRMKMVVGAVLLGAIMLAAGCGGDDGEGASSTSRPLSCTPNEAILCACAGSVATPTMGTQTCDALGASYGPCMGCPALNVLPMGGTGGSGGTGSGGAAGAMAGAMAGTSGGAGAGGAGAAGAAGGEPDGGMQNELDGSEPMPAGDVAPGVSCGVGLVTQCEQDTEKCCVRSLETDTCIPSGETCSCGLANCETMEAHCDGPEDCGSGEVCCGTLSQSGAGYDIFECATTCQSTGNQRIACHEQDPKCTGGDICANSQLLTNVQVCIDPASIQQ